MPALQQVTTSNTFGQWRTTTNLLIDGRNAFTGFAARENGKFANIEVLMVTGNTLRANTSIWVAGYQLSGVATASEALAGTSNTKFMTPQRTAQYVVASSISNTAANARFATKAYAASNTNVYAVFATKAYAAANTLVNTKLAVSNAAAIYATKAYAAANTRVTTMLQVANAAALYVSQAFVTSGFVSNTANQTVGGDKTFSGVARFTGAVSQTATGIDRIDVGVESGTPRVVFENASFTTWLVDNASGLFRWFIPGTVIMSLANTGVLSLPRTGSAIELGHASDTTITRDAAGDIAIEGNRVYRAGGTNVAIADGGTNADNAPAALTNLGGASNTYVTAVFATKAYAAANTRVTTMLQVANAVAGYVALTGNQTVAGTKTFSSVPLVPDDAYAAAWNGSTAVPTKNAVYDQMQLKAANTYVVAVYATKAYAAANTLVNTKIAVANVAAIYATKAYAAGNTATHAIFATKAYAAANTRVTTMLQVANAVAIYATKAYAASNTYVNTLSAVGTQVFWLPASVWNPTVTNGAQRYYAEDATNDLMEDSLAFDTTTQEFATTDIVLPYKYNNGTITVTPYWRTTGGSSTQTVVFGFSAVAISNDDAADATLGTAQTSTDTWIADTDLHIGPTTSAITVGGSPADADMIRMKVSRNVASDTLGVDARFQGAMIAITTDAARDA